MPALNAIKQEMQRRAIVRVPTIPSGLGFRYSYPYLNIRLESLERDDEKLI